LDLNRTIPNEADIRSFSMSQKHLMLFLITTILLLFPVSLMAQGSDDELDGEIALAIAGQTWNVVEKSGRERWDATWTLRADGKSFDAHWKHSPGGDEGDLRNFARIRSVNGASITVERPGLGTYTGQISADRKRITGKISWAAGTWEVVIAGGTIPSSTDTYVSTQTISLAGQAWEVIETAGNEKWSATWTVKQDGRTFDAHWKHQPGGDEGNLKAFARILSISGSSIVIERPGLGKYTGTISSDRRRITGKPSWTIGNWAVKLTGTAKLPAKL
jgi:hypothetical protein